MNERIKELAKQATIKTSHKYHTWGDRIATETKEVFDKEKFAESVVMECTKILADNGEFRSCVIIGKHFGVFGVEE